MLESYDDTGGCAFSIIGLIGLIAFTVCMWNAYPPDNQEVDHCCECEVEYECR